MSDKKNTKLTFNLPKTYLSVIEGSVGSQLFRHSYVNDETSNGLDVLEDGVLSCAFYVSSILKMFDLIREQHATVSGTVRDLIAAGWEEIDTPVVGAVIVWGLHENPNGEAHTHIGFCVGENEAISNSTSDRTPKRHHLTYGTEHPRTITKMLWHRNLDIR